MLKNIIVDYRVLIRFDTRHPTRVQDLELRFETTKHGVAKACLHFHDPCPDNLGTVHDTIIDADLPASKFDTMYELLRREMSHPKHMVRCLWTVDKDCGFSS